MTNRVFSALAALSLAGIGTIGIAAIGPWPNAKGDDKRSSAPSARPKCRRAPSLADRAGHFRRR